MTTPTTPIIDMHLDLAWNAVQWDRDLTLPVAEIRRRETEAGLTGRGRKTNTVSFPAMREAGVAVAGATILARHDRRGNPLPSWPPSGASTAEAAYALARGHLSYYLALERTGAARILRTRGDLDAHLSAWIERSPAAEPPPVGLVLSMEGADPILSPDDLDDWWAAGLRVVGLAHYGASRYSHGTASPGPLTPLGRKLLKRMEARGVILDVTHLSDEAMDEVLDPSGRAFGGTVVASHHNCRAIAPRQRQLRDSDIRAIADRGGVIGLSMDVGMIQPVWPDNPAERRRTATLVDLAAHAAHVRRLTGSARCLGLGSDLDGGFGSEQCPHELDTIADLPKMTLALGGAGFSPEEIRGVLAGNWLALLRRALPR
jgi:membrane dipeptidase